MKKQKDISTLIEEADKHLTVQPSADAWSRLESRLEAAPKNEKRKVIGLRPRFRFLSIAASLALLVVAIYFWQSRAPLDLASDAFKPTLMETLTGAEDCNPYCAVMKARRELPADYATGLER